MSAIKKSFVVLTVFAMMFGNSSVKAGWNVVDCCRPVLCCKPVVVDCCHRPIMNALRNARLALHYHANYRVYRDVVFATDTPATPQVPAQPTPAHSVTPSTPQVPAQPTQPATPATPLEEPKQPESLPPIDVGEDTQKAPADSEDNAEGNEPAEDDSDDSFQLQDPNATTFKLQVPENARVFVNDRETTSMGSDRIFSAANLNPNQQYRFRIRVEWIADGQQLISNRTLVLRPGTLVSVNMRSSGVDLTLPTAVQK